MASTATPEVVSEVELVNTKGDKRVATSAASLAQYNFAGYWPADGTEVGTAQLVASDAPVAPEPAPAPKAVRKPRKSTAKTKTAVDVTAGQVVASGGTAAGEKTVGTNPS